MFRDVMVSVREWVAAILLAIAVGFVSGLVLASTMNGGVSW